MIQVFTCAIILGLCCFAFVLIGIKSYKESQLNSLSNIVNVLASNSISSLEFDDNEAATELLKGLNVDESVLSAEILTKKGDFFAGYTKTKADTTQFAKKSAGNAAILSGGHIYIYQDISKNKEHIGTIRLHAYLFGLKDIAYRNARIGLVFLIIGIGIAFLVATYLQGYISNPILSLVDLVQRVTKSGNYKAEAVIPGKDEISLLATAFNDLLTQIEKRGVRIAERTLELEKNIEKLTQTEKDLLKAKELAEESGLAKERFLANMSHEIRTPMNALIGFSELLSKTPLNEEQKEYLLAMKTSSSSLMSLINDILDYSKIEAGMMRIEEIPLNIDEQFHSLEVLLLNKAQEKNLELRFISPSDIPSSLLGDPLRLSQILLNLIVNAIKFTETGQVTVSAEVLHNTSNAVTVRFQVADTGIGISPNKVETIFDRFTQASSETTRKFGGTGLGLTISKQLIELQGGTIQVNSQVGKGTSFSFELKFKKHLHVSPEPEAILDKPVQTDEPKDLSKLHILVVEDNKLNQVLATKVLQKWNTTPDIAANGKIATEMVSNTTYDIILMDIQMPEMDGREATLYIRENISKKLPIIGMSAHAMTGEKEKCILVGMNDYITKPFDPEILYAKIKQYAA